jgi:hypothetical protein
VEKQDDKQGGAENSTDAQKIWQIDHFVFIPGGGRISSAPNPSSKARPPFSERLFPPPNRNRRQIIPIKYFR